MHTFSASDFSVSEATGQGDEGCEAAARQVLQWTTETVMTSKPSSRANGIVMTTSSNKN